MLDVECRFICHSHKLNDSCFSWLRDGVHQISAQVLDEHNICIRTQLKTSDSSTGQQVAYSSHRFLLLWLVSLNVGTFAHFGLSQEKLGNRDFSAIGRKIVFQGYVEFNQNRDLPPATDFLGDDQLARSELVCIALARDLDTLVINEYTKGLFFLNSHVYGIDLLKESFSKFYRLFEHFITRRILKTKKLSNEMKDICRALEKVGIPSKIGGMFRTELYPIRSAQVMHAWQDQVSIEPEIVLKMKLLCDAVMYKSYEPAWKNAIESGDTEHAQDS